MKKAKRILLPLILALLLVAVAVFATACSGNDSPDKNYSPASDFAWEIVDGKVNITGYTGNDKEVVIPPVINLTPVASIGNSAFFGCTNLTSITLPEGVTSIGYAAFFACENLASITIPDSVTSIGVYAFYYCDNLTSIDIPEGVTSIGYSAFSDCTNLTIYCEATTQPEGWEDGWNSSECPVVWGYEAKE